MATNQSWITDLMKFVKRGGPEGVAALELALIQEALLDLDRLRPELEKVAAEAVLEKRMSNRRFYRAVAKAALKTGMRPPESVMQVIRKEERPTVRTQVRVEGYTNRHGTQRDDYWRSLPEGKEAPEGEETRQHPEDLKELREWENRERDRRDRGDAAFSGENPYSEGIQNALDFDLFEFEPSISGPKDKTRDTFRNVTTSQTSQDAVRTYLQQDSAASGVRAVADFFSGATTGKFQFAWNAISKFGPIAGTRVAFNYYRTGGYALPLEQDGSEIYTEFGDKLPAPESKEKTRNWAISALISRLPGQSAYNTRSEPPSEGFIVDKSGHIVAHAVGRGNDNWLPFNMTQLRALRKDSGAEYIRSRLVGGPTAEDISTAMALGVDRLTIVSQSGVFSMQIKQRAHGIKIEHMQIIERYNELLDEMRAGKGPKGARLDFNGYNVALGALASEFPLHLSVRPSDIRRNENGVWHNMTDYVRPEKRLTDQIRDLFNIENDEVQQAKSAGTSFESFQQKTDREKKNLRAQILGMPANQQSVSAWVREQNRRNPQNKATMLNRLQRYYNEKGDDANKISWIREEFNLDRDKSPSDMTQPARVVTPNDPDLRPVTVRDVGDMTHVSEVTETKVAPTAQKAKSGRVKTDNFQVASRRISQLGLNPDTSEDKSLANKVLQQMEGLDNDEFNDFWEGWSAGSLNDPNHIRLRDNVSLAFRPS